jgi:uncharacterized membrane-anchored protein
VSTKPSLLFQNMHKNNKTLIKMITSHMKMTGQHDPEISCALNTAISQPMDTAQPNIGARDCVYYSSRVYAVISTCLTDGIKSQMKRNVHTFTTNSLSVVPVTAIFH